MTETITTPRRNIELKVERPRLHKVMRVNDDFTPREFMATVLKAEFHLGAERPQQIMTTAHKRGVCMVAVFTEDVTETKAIGAADAGRKKGYPPLFTMEPEEWRG